MPGYIFLGPEIGQKQDEIEALRKKLAAQCPAGSSFEETVFYAGETPALTIVNTVQNHSLFAQSRLFIVKNADQIKFPKKNEITLIASCMKDLDSDTTMILVSDELKLDAGIDNSCPKENRKIFYEMFENKKSEWVYSFFKRSGYSIDPDGVDTVLEMVENNTDALRRECSRLMLLLPKNRPISAEDIEQRLSHSREESAFTLFSRIAAGDISRSVESLHTLLAAKEKAPGIFAVLASCFRKLRDYIGLLKNGEPDNFELKKIGLSSPKARSDYSMAERRYDAAAVDSCLALTAEYDILTRSSGTVLESTLMDVYLLKLFALQCL